MIGLSDLNVLAQPSLVHLRNFPHADRSIHDVDSCEVGPVKWSTSHAIIGALVLTYHAVQLMKHIERCQVLTTTSIVLKQDWILRI
jgi:hypothetical protein